MVPGFALGLAAFFYVSVAYEEALTGRSSRMSKIELRAVLSAGSPVGELCVSYEYRSTNPLSPWADRGRH